MAITGCLCNSPCCRAVSAPRPPPTLPVSTSYPALHTTATHIHATLIHTQPVQVATLEGHQQSVSGLDWSRQGDQILSCSHDRNAFVWSRGNGTSKAGAGASGGGGGGGGSGGGGGGGSWEKQMVITRLTKGALCVKWSPSEAKVRVWVTGVLVVVVVVVREVRERTVENEGHAAAGGGYVEGGERLRAGGDTHGELAGVLDGWGRRRRAG